VWEEIYERMAALIREHRTTLVFVDTRKMAERIAARLIQLLGDGQVACRHGSLSRPRRLEAEARLKGGKLRALVATAPLELGIDVGDDPLFKELERDGVVLRARIDGREAWCDRRLLARIHRYTLERLRREIEPVSARVFLRFLAAWQHPDEGRRLEGPLGVLEVIEQLAGFEAPAAAWEAAILPARVRDYRRDWLDQLTLSGQVAWGRPSPRNEATDASRPGHSGPDAEDDSPFVRNRRRSWARRIQKTWLCDPELCPRLRS